MRFRRMIALAASLLALVATSCQGASRAPFPIHPVNWTRDALESMPPGQELGVLDLSLVNRSANPVILSRIATPGTGVGTVGVITQVSIAPWKYGARVISALYGTNPPVSITQHGCVKQALYPVKGYRLAPRASAQVWVVIRFERPGAFKINGYSVTYASSGATYTQWFPYSFVTTIQVGATPQPLNKAERPCVRLTHLLSQGPSGG